MGYVLLDKERYNTIVNNLVIEKALKYLHEFNSGTMKKTDPRYSILEKFKLYMATPEKYRSLIKHTAEQIFLWDIDFWTYNSLKCDNKEEILALIIKNTICNNSSSYICISYLCSNPIMDNDLLDEIIYVSNDLFTWDYYNEKNIKVMTDFVKRHIEENDLCIQYDKKFKKDFKFDNTDERKQRSYEKGYRGRIDWFGIGKGGQYYSLCDEYQAAVRNSKVKALYTTSEIEGMNMWSQ